MAVAVIVALPGLFGSARTVALNLTRLRLFRSLGLSVLVRGVAADFLFTTGDLRRSLLHASNLLADHFANRRPVLVRGGMQFGPTLADPLAQELQLGFVIGWVFSHVNPVFRRISVEPRVSVRAQGTVGQSPRRSPHLRLKHPQSVRK